MSELLQQLTFVGKGLGLTLQLLGGALTTGFILGLFWAICRQQGLAPFLINRLISILRGTPVILQLSLVYFSAPILIGIKTTILSAGILAFGLNCSAYFAEIFRAGIESIPKGQFEAAASLNIKSYLLWKDIILPQVLANTFPALINEIIALLKETALISTIGGMDLMRHSQSLAAEQFTYFLPLCIAGAYYYSLVLLIEALGKCIARRGIHATY
jgi:polar amino acid transport system permease protein